jgi:hypothetical protein
VADVNLPITGGSGTASGGTIIPNRAVGLSGWFSPGKSYALAGNVGTGAVGTVIYSTFSGNTIYAASPALADVQAAIALANNGDRVIVPAGNATWSSRLEITKYIILVAAGLGQTNITSNYNAVNNSWYESTDTYLISWVPSNPSLNLPFRLSGFDLDCAGKCGGVYFSNSNSTSAVKKVRMDHMGIKSCSSLYHSISGPVWGCADHNVLDARALAARPDMIDNMGDYATTWNNFTFNFGTIDNFYWEDNTVHTRHGDVWDDGAGNRYCARYNTIHHWEASGGQGLFPLFQIHGNLGSMGCELYENTILMENWRGCYLAIQRGGKTLVYNNHLANPSGWDIRIWEEYIDTDDPPAFNPAGEPQHPSDSYYWSNGSSATYVMPTDIGSTVNYPAPLSRIVPMEDKDFWNHKASFNGSSGVGVGLLSARPATCTTEGVGWWATDQSKLYRWHNNSWEEYYVPYTYPHPYRSDPILGD